MVGAIQTGPIKGVNTESATYTSLIQGYSPTGSAAGFQSTNPAVNAFDGNPATNAMNESETAGAYVALDMKFINVNLRVQFKGTAKIMQASIASKATELRPKETLR